MPASSPPSISAFQATSDALRTFMTSSDTCRSEWTAACAIEEDFRSQNVLATSSMGASILVPYLLKVRKVLVVVPTDAVGYYMLDAFLGVPGAFLSQHAIFTSDGAWRPSGMLSTNERDNTTPDVVVTRKWQSVCPGLFDFVLVVNRAKASRRWPRRVSDIVAYFARDSRVLVLSSSNGPSP